MTRVKICGITSAADAQAAVAAGADAIGFVFAPSPRRLLPEQAAAIARTLPALISRVGVFVDRPAAEILQICRIAALDTVQLHGQEPPALVAQLKAEGLRVIKAMAVRAASAAELAEALTPYAAADALLLDSYVPGVAGGSGATFAWPLAADAARRWPVVLAGGLRADNVAEALACVRPFGVDVSSGVEASPGRKSLEKIRTFIARVRRFDVDSFDDGQRPIR